MAFYNDAILDEKVSIVPEEVKSNETLNCDLHINVFRPYNEDIFNHPTTEASLTAKLHNIILPSFKTSPTTRLYKQIRLSSDNLD